MRRLLMILPAASLFLGALLVYGCSRDSPAAPDLPVAEKRDRTLIQPPQPDPPPAGGLTATELLGDPLLHLMLGNLRDPDGAGAITALIEATRVSLADGDTESARSNLDDAYTALRSYIGTAGVDDEDVLHLDAAQLFLDEVEALIGSEKPRGRRKK